MKDPGQKLGVSIRGGARSHPGNPLDKTDEGIFVSKVRLIYCLCRVGTVEPAFSKHSYSLPNSTWLFQTMLFFIQINLICKNIVNEMCA